MKPTARKRRWTKPRVTLALALALAGGALLAPGAARASQGCTVLNLPALDGFYTGGAQTQPFAAGDTITFTASTPASSTSPPTAIYLMLDLVVVDTDPFPGTLTFTIPTSATFTVSWNTIGGDATWSVSCTPALAVGMRSFTGRRDASGVLVRWRAASTLGTLGFNLYREVHGQRVRVNTRLIAPRVSGSYSFRDRRAPRARAVRYWLQEVRLDGSRSWYGPAHVQSIRRAQR